MGEAASYREAVKPEGNRLQARNESWQRAHGFCQSSGSASATWEWDG